MAVDWHQIETPPIVQEMIEAFGREPAPLTLALVGWACISFEGHGAYNLNERLSSAICALAGIAFGQTQYGNRFSYT